MNIYQKTHSEILKYLKSIKGVHEVRDTLETPNKYGDNVSYFTVVCDYEDKYNNRKVDINIDWGIGRMFIRNKGYYNFKTFNDFKSIIKKYAKIK